jgi:ATP/maltotriose-dependent transcriptional regulator MalT
MMDPMEDPTEALVLGQRAVDAGNWAAAIRALEPLVAEGDPAVLEAYGLATWFTGGLERGMQLRQQACLAYGDRGQCDRAARLAAWISHQYHVSGSVSLSNGWLARAERALDGHGECAGAGWVLIERARRAGCEGCLEASLAALAIGRTCGDGDLEVFALSMIGRAEVAAGRWDAGIERLEEAMAAASAGRIRNPNTLGEAYCNMLVASTNAGDWERAAEWCEFVYAVATRADVMPLRGACRTIHADVLMATGRWSDAEEALLEALDAHARHIPAMSAPTLALLATLRVRRGDLTEAARLLAERDDGAPSLVALAALRLAEGSAEAAQALLERALARADGDLMVLARILAALVDASLAVGDGRRARSAADQLAEITRSTDRPHLHALAALAEARIAASTGMAAAAEAHALAALDRFFRLGMPYEAAEARIELAHALAAGGSPLALDEARSALAAFRDLGAGPDADRAAALTRELGAGSAPGIRAEGPLTAREAQVLALVAEGRTNAQIAATLFISEKTAGHHVSSILAKLGVRNRTEAAARAASLGISTRR